MDKRLTIKDYSTKEEIEAIVTKYLEDGNTFSELIKKEGFWTWGDNTHNRQVMNSIPWTSKVS